MISNPDKEASRGFRFRTRDLTRLIIEPFPCGRGLRRMGRVMGCTDDIFIIDMEVTESYYQIVIERKGSMEEATALVEASEGIFFHRMKKRVNWWASSRTGNRKNRCDR